MFECMPCTWPSQPAQLLPWLSRRSLRPPRRWTFGCLISTASALRQNSIHLFLEIKMTWIVIWVLHWIQFAHSQTMPIVYLEHTCRHLSFTSIESHGIHSPLSLHVICPLVYALICTRVDFEEQHP